MTGTAPGTGQVLEITWAAIKPSANYVVQLTAANAAAVTALRRVYIDQATISASTVELHASTALAASTTYEFYFSVLCY